MMVKFCITSGAVYAPPATDPWDGEWHLVIVPPAAIDETSRRELRKELGWDGFGVLGPGLFVRPARAGNEAELTETTRALGITRHVAVVTARALWQSQRGGSIAAMTQDCWDLKSVAKAYRGFVSRFQGVARALSQRADPTAQQCFVLRTLLIHEFRRVTLHDPQLPVELLPSDWPETAAYGLCRDLYRLTHERAERHLAAVLNTLAHRDRRHRTSTSASADFGARRVCESANASGRTSSPSLYRDAPDGRTAVMLSSREWRRRERRRRAHAGDSTEDGALRDAPLPPARSRPAAAGSSPG